MTELAEIDRAIDGILVQLGQMVLRLSNAGVTNNAEERQALARSVNSFPFARPIQATPACNS